MQNGLDHEEMVLIEHPLLTGRKGNDDSTVPVYPGRCGSPGLEDTDDLEWVVSEKDLFSNGVFVLKNVLLDCLSYNGNPGQPRFVVLLDESSGLRRRVPDGRPVWVRGN